MTPRPRVITVSVAVCTLLVIASVAAGFSTLGAPTDGGHRVVDESGDIGGASGQSSTTGETQTNAASNRGSLLNRSALPERTPDGRTYRSIVIFRDDDIQSNNRPKTMRAVNRIFVNQDVPVTLAVIPRMAGQNISETATCSYLVQLKRAHPKLFELSLHGYNHTNETGFHGASEFGGLSLAEQETKVSRGKALLHACTGLTPQTFVPPFNTYDENTTVALRENGIRTISGADWFTNTYYNRTGPFVANGTVHVPETNSFVENWTTDAFYDRGHARRAFDRAYENRSVYVQMLHYSTFNTSSKRDRLRGLIQYMKNHKGVKFMTVEEFGRAMRDGTLTRTADGWRYANTTASTGSGAVGANTSSTLVPTDRKQLSNGTMATTAASSASPITNQAVETNRRVDS